jgi:hypothetical protein
MLGIPVEQYAYISMLAAEIGLSLEEFVLQCLPHPEGKVSDTDLTDQIRQAEEIRHHNQEILEQLSK